MLQVTTVFVVTDYKTGKSYREFIDATGQDAVMAVRKPYPRFTKFVLEGFEIEGKFVPLKLDTNRNI